MDGVNEQDVADPLSFKSDMPVYKIVLVGDGGTGKSSFASRLNDGGFRKDYIATLGIEKHEILVETSQGNFKLIICDTAGQEKVGPLRDSYYEGIDGAVLFFDVTSRVTYKNVPLWHKDVTRVASNIPVVLCGNKMDIDSSLIKVKPKNVTYGEKHNIKYFAVSVKNEKNLKEAVEYLLQQIRKCPSLSITGSLGTLIYNNLEKLNI
ncbi:UNVERIFIED_CONTAM: hypothetical protein RMT77_003369 [Armadillidium vulgare]